MSVFEQFLDDHDSQHLSRQNNPYLSLGHVRTALKLAGDDVTEQQVSAGSSSFIDHSLRYGRFRRHLYGFLSQVKHDLSVYAEAVVSFNAYTENIIINTWKICF